jgi:16S rRNA processing protein RimM
MNFIPVGQIVAAHGLKGEVKFRYYNETGSASLQYRSFFVDQDDKKIKLKLLRARLQGGVFVLQFKGLDTLEKVRSLLKKELFVAEKDLPVLDEGEYYDYQLIGLEAVTEDGRPIGKVRDVMHTGANDILVIEGVSELLVPMMEEYIVDISRDAGFVRVKAEALVE